MVTMFRTDREYLLEGTVVDRSTQRGAGALLVTAWYLDTRYHDMLGQAFTDADGAFVIGFDRRDVDDDAKPENGIDVAFRVTSGDTVVLETFNRPRRNLQRGTTQVKLEVDLPQVPAGRDRVSTEQAFKAIDWWRASDFRGVYAQRKNQARTVANTAIALLGDALRNFDFEPVRVQGASERQLINQSPASARSALAQQQVEVTEVRPLGSLDMATVKRLAAYPVDLHPGDRVTLYERDGAVQYYTRDAAPVASAQAQTVARIDEDVQTIKARVGTIDDLRAELANVKTVNAETAARTADDASQVQAQAAELARLRGELEQVQQANANKDAQIAKLKSDLTLVTNAQDELAARLPLDRLSAIEAQLKRLGGTAPTPGSPGTRTAPGGKPGRSKPASGKGG